MLINFFIIILVILILFYILKSNEAFYTFGESNIEQCVKDSQIIPSYLKRMIEQNRLPSNNQLDLCDMDNEIFNEDSLGSVENVPYEERGNEENIKRFNDYKCLLSESCDHNKCFYNQNVLGNCRSIFAKEYLEGLIDNNNSNANNSNDNNSNNNNSNNISNIVEDDNVNIREIVQVRKRYSDDTCNSLKKRGFEVICTYDEELEDDDSIFHLNKALNIMPKRIDDREV